MYEHINLQVMHLQVGQPFTYTLPNGHRFLQTGPHLRDPETKIELIIGKILRHNKFVGMSVNSDNYAGSNTFTCVLKCIKCIKYMELNGLRTITCLRKSEVLLKAFQIETSLKNWQGMAYTVCNASEPMTSYVY